jgi:hypothetical protein
MDGAKLNRKEGENLLNPRKLFSKFSRRFKCLSISQFWSEKLMIIFQSLHLFALVFAANFDNWPNEWIAIVYRTPMPYVTLDFANIFHEAIIESGLMSLYGGMWICILLVLGVVYAVIWGLLYKALWLRVKFVKLALLFAHALYIPAMLGVLPYTVCTYDDCWETVMG